MSPVLEPISSYHREPRSHLDCAASGNRLTFDFSLNEDGASPHVRIDRESSNTQGWQSVPAHFIFSPHPRPVLRYYRLEVPAMCREAEPGKIKEVTAADTFA